MSGIKNCMKLITSNKLNIQTFCDVIKICEDLSPVEYCDASSQNIFDTSDPISRWKIEVRVIREDA